MTKTEQAIAMFKSGSNCAQSVFCVFAQDLDIDPVQAHRLATGLGAGLGRKQLLCGAVNGGAMAIGAAMGNDRGADEAAKEKTYATVLEYVEKIERTFGCTDCKGLLGVDLRSDAGKADFKSKDLKTKVCNRIIEGCVEEVERILAAASSAADS